jgi:Spy/CpxP family protein refolding chaperone
MIMKRSLSRSLSLGFAAALLLSTALTAAPRGNGGNRGNSSSANAGTATRGERGFVAGLTRALDLTAEQQTAVTALYTTLQTNLETIRDQQEAQREEIRTLLEGDNPDPLVIGQKVIAAHATREQAEALFDTFTTQVSALLTAAQLEKFEALIAANDGHGPFGFGFGRGPGF